MKPVDTTKVMLVWPVWLILSVTPVLAQQGSGAHPNPSQSPVRSQSQPSIPFQPDTFPMEMDPWDQNELILRSNIKPSSSKMVNEDDGFLLPQRSGYLDAGQEQH